ncbi:DNA mismatch repair protein Mlh1 [Kalaharituber pfeilii]|nr:DNA mismatch repair protein Mlh1 [Kalaharituber pfeilii]
MDVDSENQRVRGTKRKANEALSSSPAGPRRIKALDQNVVNKIAAGEIIVAPVHALKELIENSVDAGATSIEVLVKDGGLKLLQITDNGHGINRDDLPILCERFTTSKLQQFEDLAAIGTYGFRGEALASVSHIAHLTVTTKTKDSNCAWRAVYSDGKLVPPKPGMSADPKPVAGKQGTQITVEDLFYNVPSRRRAFRSVAEEYSKILDIYGDADLGVSTSSIASTVDRIRNIHGSAVANELLSVQVSDKQLGFKATGLVSSANYSVKKTALLLFINHRSVESSLVKKNVEATYALFLPKGGHPFVYLSIEIEPHRVDVNVHPTKREVNFLHEDEIVEKITEQIRKQLAAVDTSRSYLTQTLIPGGGNNAPLASDKSSQPQISTHVKGTSSGIGKSLQAKKPYENNLNRVDARAQKITTLLKQQNSLCIEVGDERILEEPREWQEFHYKTLKRLRADVRESMHNGLCEVFRDHTFVGIVDESRRLAAIQHGVKLYLVDYAAVSFELFYQVGLSDFGNFGTIKLDPPLEIRDLLQIAAEQEKQIRAHDDVIMGDSEESTFDWDEAIDTTTSLLIDKRAMLLDYFNMTITEEGTIYTLPLLVKGYLPSMGKLPTFLLRLGPNVDWTSELECFESMLREIAGWYVPEMLPSSLAPVANDPVGGEGADINLESRKEELVNALENVLFPLFRKRLVPPKSLLAHVSEVANLKGLYRIFERC